MEAKAIANFVHVSPRKASQMTDMIRGKNVVEALTLLKFSPKGAGKIVIKVLKSAVANSKQKNIQKLTVKDAYVGAGPTMKRMRAMAMGRGATIRKRTSHITIVVAEQ
ncbi:MAG: 50S ribosomal protein L22 [bacterium]|nr:50S ribosomal protein L22 [bacterium]